MQSWNAHVIETLRQLRAQGWSYSAAAKKINVTFGTCFTRQAMIGKAHRLGMAARSQAPSKPGRPLVDEPAASPRRADPLQRSSLAPLAAVPAEMPVDWRPLRCADITPRLVALLDLEAEHCRYPYGDGPYLFCGHLRRPGSSYCPAHADLVAGPDAILAVGSVVDRDTATESQPRMARSECHGDQSIYFDRQAEAGQHHANECEEGQRHAARQTQKA